MDDRILVAYATKCGSTAEVAELVGKLLGETGAQVDVRRAHQVRDVSAYTAVVLGTAIRMCHPLGEMTSFVNAKQKMLYRMPVALFSVGLMMRVDTPENRQKAQGFLTPLISQFDSLAGLGLFGGKVDYSKLPFYYRWMFSQDKSGEISEGDWRDWQAIQTWAQEVAPKLLGAA